MDLTFLDYCMWLIIFLYLCTLCRETTLFKFRIKFGKDNTGVGDLKRTIKKIKKNVKNKFKDHPSHSKYFIYFDSDLSDWHNNPEWREAFVSMIKSEYDSMYDVELVIASEYKIPPSVRFRSSGSFQRDRIIISRPEYKSINNRSILEEGN